MKRAKNGEPVPLNWKGDLTIQRIAELKEELHKKLKSTDRLLLDLSEATEFDAAFLQLLCSAHRSATALNKQLGLSGMQGHAARIREAGFVRHIGCAQDCSNSCIWVDRKRAAQEDA